MTEPKLYVHGVSGFGLFATRCKRPGCGELTVHGFWDQLEHRVVNKPKRRAWVWFTCGKCGTVRRRAFVLTPNGKSHRLVHWDRLPWVLVPLLRLGLPFRWWAWFARRCVWLEYKFPI